MKRERWFVSGKWIYTSKSSAKVMDEAMEIYADALDRLAKK